MTLRKTILITGTVMQSAEDHAWPSKTGASLLLIPLEYDREGWRAMLPSLRHDLLKLGVDVHMGVEVCAPPVGDGVRAISWIESADVLVFKCPISLGECWEALPLCSASSREVPLQDILGVFQTVNEHAEQHAISFAWIQTHDWPPGERVRWESGTPEDFEQFLASERGWSTLYFDTDKRIVVEGPPVTYWYEIYRRSGCDRTDQATLRRPAAGSAA